MRRLIVAVAGAMLVAACAPAPTAPRIVRVEAGGIHSCALLSDSTVECWGDNQWGQLGDGSTTPSRTAVKVAGLRDVTAISAGGAHTCALLSDRTVRCWGSNGDGRLGNGTTTDSSLPVQVLGLSTVTAISARGTQSCALLADQTARCWGNNDEGQLGDGTTADAPTPVAVAGLAGATSVAVNFGHACAVLADGTAKCWGRNQVGQLGNGTTNLSNVPVPVLGLSSIAQVSLGVFHTCALLRDGTVSCWGANSYGQLGDGTTTGYTAHPLPAAVSALENATAISAGGDQTCALLSETTVRCWGRNDDGRLGDGTQQYRTVPTPVLHLTDAVTISTLGLDAGHTCAALRDGTARCWGANGHGELGDGTIVSSSAPVTVVRPLGS